MNKQDIIRLMSEELRRPVGEITKCVNLFLSEVERSVRNGTPVRINGFGIFKPVHYPGRTIYGFGDRSVTHSIEGHSVMGFQSSRTLRKRMRAEH